MPELISRGGALSRDKSRDPVVWVPWILMFSRLCGTLPSSRGYKAMRSPTMRLIFLEKRKKLLHFAYNTTWLTPRATIASPSSSVGVLHHLHFPPAWGRTWRWWINQQSKGVGTRRWGNLHSYTNHIFSSTRSHFVVVVLVAADVVASAMVELKSKVLLARLGALAADATYDWVVDTSARILSE